MATGKAVLEGLAIRPLRSLDEFHETVRVQKDIWAFSDEDLVAPRLFTVFSRIGGSCLGAFVDGRLLGFALAFTARKPDGRPYWHSHMAGVSPEAQGFGVGRALKLRQREAALDARIDRIEWTFDPLQARNAHFNIEKLGVRVEAYLRNFYGITSSALHGSLPTDRLLVSWNLQDPEVVARLYGRRPPFHDGEAGVAVPLSIRDVPDREARRLQRRIRAEFDAFQERGMHVVGFRREDGGKGAYLFA